MDFKVAILQQKKMLRKEVLSKRRAYNQNELAIQSNNICQKIIKMPLFESSLNIMVYLAMADEVNIDNLIKELEIILNSIVMNKNRITDSRIKFIKDTNNI